MKSSGSLNPISSSLKMIIFSVPLFFSFLDNVPRIYDVFAVAKSGGKNVAKPGTTNGSGAYTRCCALAGPKISIKRKATDGGVLFELIY